MTLRQFAKVYCDSGFEKVAVWGTLARVGTRLATKLGPWLMKAKNIVGPTGTKIGRGAWNFAKGYTGLGAPTAGSMAAKAGKGMFMYDLAKGFMPQRQKPPSTMGY